jgi:hypothetical protein
VSGSFALCWDEMGLLEVIVLIAFLTTPTLVINHEVKLVPKVLLKNKHF